MSYQEFRPGSRGKQPRFVQSYSSGAMWTSIEIPDAAGDDARAAAEGFSARRYDKIHLVRKYSVFRREMQHESRKISPGRGGNDILMRRPCRNSADALLAPKPVLSGASSGINAEFEAVRNCRAIPLPGRRRSSARAGSGAAAAHFPAVSAAEADRGIPLPEFFWDLFTAGSRRRRTMSCRVDVSSDIPAA